MHRRRVRWARGVAYSTIFERPALISPRLTLPSTRRRCELRVGRVGCRGARFGRDLRDELGEPRQRVGAVLLLAPIALRLDDHHAIGRDPLVAKASKRALMASGSEDAAMSKRRCIAVDTLLTFCPPAPCARIAVHSISASGIRIVIAGASPRSPDKRARARRDRRAFGAGVPSRLYIDSWRSVSGFLMSAFCRGGGAPYSPAGGFVSSRESTDASLQLLGEGHADLIAGDPRRAKSTAGRAWR